MWADVFAAHYGSMFGKLLNMDHTPDEARAIIANAFVNVAGRNPSADKPSSYAWRSVRNARVDWIRKRGKVFFCSDSALARLAISPHPYDIMARADKIKQVRRSVDLLTASQRTGNTEGAVKQLQHRAFVTLRQRLAVYG